MDRVQIVAYLPEYYADFIHLFRQGWWENVPRAMIQGITRKKFQKRGEHKFLIFSRNLQGENARH